MKFVIRPQELFDSQLPSLKEHADALTRITPERGWICTLRQLLHMSSTAMAERLGIAHSGLLKIEKGERAGTVSLGTLRRAAAAIDAEFVYAVVPRTPVSETLATRALEVARISLLHATPSARLSLTDEEFERGVADLARELEAQPRRLWRSTPVR